MNAFKLLSNPRAGDIQATRCFLVALFYPLKLDIASHWSMLTDYINGELGLRLRLSRPN